MAKKKLVTDRAFTWDQYLAHVKTRHTVQGPARWGREGLEGNDRKWAGTRTLNEAIELAEAGWPEGTARMLQELEHEMSGDLPSLFPARDYDLAGEFPDVAAYCAGQLDHMVSMDEANTGISFVIRLGVNGGVPAHFSPEAVTKYGAAVLSHAVAFQKAGYSVAIDWIKVARTMGEKVEQVHLLRVELLTAGGVLDVDRAAFILTHPSMLRRLWFADIETLPEAKALAGYYGVSESPKTHAPPGWYEGIALPSIRECGDTGPNPETATVEEIAQWLGEYIDRELNGEPAQAA